MGIIEIGFSDGFAIHSFGDLFDAWVCGVRFIFNLMEDSDLPFGCNAGQGLIEDVLFVILLASFEEFTHGFFLDEGSGLFDFVDEELESVFV